MLPGAGGAVRPLSRLLAPIAAIGGNEVAVVAFLEVGGGRGRIVGRERVVQAVASRGQGAVEIARGGVPPMSQPSASAGATVASLGANGLCRPSPHLGRVQSRWHVAVLPPLSQPSVSVGPQWRR